MPAAVGVQLVVKLAVDIPLVVLIAPLPVTPVLVVQALSLYNVNVTDPVGADEVVPWNVAVSLRFGMFTPAVPLLGFELVVIVAEALPTVIGSLLQPLDAGSLLVSPENDATQ